MSGGQAMRRSGLAVLAALLIAFLALLPAAGPAPAVEPGEMLANPQLEARAREISAQLRCLVCRNENIDESGAPLAHDLRLLVRERLRQGDSNAQVLHYMVARYGEYVLLKPPFRGSAMLLWLLPPLIFAAAAFYLLMRRRRAKAAAGGAAPAPLSAAEKAELAAILADKPQTPQQTPRPSLPPPQKEA